MRGSRREKLVYVLPRYNARTDEHFYHLYDFIEELGKSVDVFVVIERSWGQPRFRNVKDLYTQRFPWIPLRFLELAAVLVYACAMGYRRVFSRYAYGPGLLAPLLHLVGMETYYWNCGMAKEYFRPWRLNWKDLAWKLRGDVPLTLTLSLVRHLVTGTERMADYYAESFGLDRGSIIVVPNEILLDRFRHVSGNGPLPPELSDLEGKRIVLFVHRLWASHGAQHIVPIAERVVRDLPDTVFVVVGSGPLEPQVKAEVAARKLEGVVRLVGARPNRDIPRYYGAADVFIMPSELEGFPRVLLEAMAAGTPFVATDVGGVRDVVSDLQKQWSLVPRGDIDGFARRVVTLLQDPDLRAQLSQDGSSHVQNFTLPRVCELFRQRILAGRP